MAALIRGLRFPGSSWILYPFWTLLVVTTCLLELSVLHYSGSDLQSRPVLETERLTTQWLFVGGNAAILVIGILLMDMYRRSMLRKEYEGQQYYKFFMESQDLMAFADANGRFTKMNPAGIDLLGYTEAEIVGRPFMDFVHHEDVQATIAAVTRQQATGESFPFSNKFVCKDGSSVHLTWQAMHSTTDGTTFSTARNMSAQVKADAERERLYRDLQVAYANIKTLRGLIPICASCKKIRDDSGYWNTLEQYISEHSDARFTHGICPDCLKRDFPDAYEKQLGSHKER
jgi:PAS domain S-box-containing protein